MKHKVEAGLVNAILHTSESNNIPIRPLKLQKLLYYVVGFFWEEYNTWLLNDDFEAWPYGPVHRDTYVEFVQLEGGRINRMATFDEDGKVYRYSNETPDIIKTVSYVVSLLGKTNDFLLSDVTHASGSPWESVSFHEKESIPSSTIKSYFAVNPDGTLSKAKTDLRSILPTI